ncbi:MAG: hypothetical protein JSS49_07235 [Planctomycetes bacterium]|nr:hypothetical protein [Planctomycetota bacterium]
MTWARRETIEGLFQEACGLQVVDAHTHIQDDLTDFDDAMASRNLAGTQASINSFPQAVVDVGLKQKRLVRRTMTDVTHSLLYSWFAEIAEGHRGKLDVVLKSMGANSEQERRQAGVMLLGELRDSRYSEYAEWLRFMFRMYSGTGATDPLDLACFDRVYDAVKQQRNDPTFAARILHQNNIIGYVTSIENRDRIPADPKTARVDQVNLAHATHPEAFNMFDAHYFIWPQGATDFGLFTGGHKFEGEKYLINLERILGCTIQNVGQLKGAIKQFVTRILYSPTHNPTSRVRYTNLFHPIDYRFGRPYDSAAVNTAIRYRKEFLRGDDLLQLTAVSTEAMLEVLDEIGADLKRSGAASGSCLQIAIGVTYFMDPAREIQSFPCYAAGLPQDEYAVWTNYPNIHFEYIVAQEQLYADFSNAAKQVGNVSVGPWWHFFRKHKIASMMYDQLSMGPISSIASGFTDARFVEMLAAKYRSVRWAVAAALAEFVDDPASSMDHDAAVGVMREILLVNPCRVHHLPFEVAERK